MKLQTIATTQTNSPLGAGIDPVANMSSEANDNSSFRGLNADSIPVSPAEFQNLIIIVVVAVFALCLFLFFRTKIYETAASVFGVFGKRNEKSKTNIDE